MRERKPFEERLFSSCALLFPNLFESSFPFAGKDKDNFFTWLVKREVYIRRSIYNARKKTF